jgi:16S rRNA processing protein RimM
MSEAAHDSLVVGRITGCYGIKGWVKIHSYTEPMENFLGFSNWRVRRRSGEETVVFDQGRRHGKGLVAHLEGVDDRTAAEAYVGLEVLISREQLPTLDQGDYYWHQLEGLAVWCTTGDEPVLLGRVNHLLETGANDVLVVEACAGSVDGRERLIPYLPGDVVRRVDLAAARMEVDWPPEF